LGNPGGFLNIPSGIALDSVNGKMYIASSGNNKIVRANLDGSGGTDLGNPGGFLNIPSGIALDAAFNKTSPANGATNQSTSLTLTWGSSIGATSYEYCYDTTNDNNCDGSWESAGSNLSVNLNGLSAGTAYFWQVRARNDNGVTNANGGGWWEFITSQSNPNLRYQYLPIILR